MKNRYRTSILATGAVALLVWLSPGARALDFIRGDANGDGSVSVADAHKITNWLFRGRIYPSCLKAADTDDDGHVDVTDAVYIINFAVLGGSPPPAPFPAAGPDETVDELTCDAYGEGSPL
jgi:hypothetical protein